MFPKNGECPQGVASLCSWAADNEEQPSSFYIKRLGLIADLIQIPYVYDFITKTCRQQAEVIQNHENENVHYIGQGEARHRKYKRLKLGGGHVYDCSSV
jgi:hypothetical protein